MEQSDLIKKIDELEKRIKELEARPADPFAKLRELIEAMPKPTYVPVPIYPAYPNPYWGEPYAPYTPWRQPIVWCGTNQLNGTVVQ